MVYECHLTMSPVQTRDKYTVEGMGLSYSQIDNDPDLGKGSRAYATFHRDGSIDMCQVIADLEKYNNYLLEAGAKVIRRKIEVVIYDRRK